MVKTLKIKKHQQREFKIQVEAKKIEVYKKEDGKRYIKFPFSSEFPVERYGYIEVLSHEVGCMVEDRLRSHAPHLYNHNWDVLIGKVVDCGIENKVAWVEVLLSEAADVSSMITKIEEEILVNVSFGYVIDKIKLFKKGAEGELDTFLATKWTPYETSSVTVPADYTVGLGRSMERDLEEEIELEVEGSEDENPSVIEPLENTSENSDPPGGNSPGGVDNQTVPITTTNGGSKMTITIEQLQARNKRIVAFGKESGLEKFAAELSLTEKTWDECYDALMEKAGAEKRFISPDDGNIGLTKKEIGDFKLTRLLHALSNPNESSAQKAAAFELEVSAAAKKLAGKDFDGGSMPLDIMRDARFGKVQQRDQSVSTGSEGGFLVEEKFQSFIEINRRNSVVKSAGATEIYGVKGNLIWPRQTAGSQFYWVGEDTALTKSALTFGQLTMQAKTVGARVVASRKSFIVPDISMEMKIRADISAGLGLGIDYAAIKGSGSDHQPAGLNVIDGLVTKNFAGDVPTFAEVVDMAQLIKAGLITSKNLKYLFNAAMEGSLQTTPKVGTYPVFLLENGLLNGFKTDSSEQIDTGEIWLGAWEELCIAYWSGVDFIVNPYTQDDVGNVIITARQDCDIAPMRIEAFAKGANNP